MAAIEGRRASRAELLAWRARLSKWRKPAAFGHGVQAMRRLYGDHVLDQPGSVFREAFFALRCANELGAELVRLGADPPDLEVMVEERVRCFEVVEVQRPGRRRGDELQADRAMGGAAPTTRHIEEHEWTSASAALAHLRAAVMTKTAKSYADASLVVYLNVYPVTDEGEVKAGLKRAVAPGLSHFQEIWVWDNGELHRFSGKDVDACSLGLGKPE